MVMYGTRCNPDISNLILLILLTPCNPCLIVIKDDLSVLRPTLSRIVLWDVKRSLLSDLLV